MEPQAADAPVQYHGAKEGAGFLGPKRLALPKPLGNAQCRDVTGDRLKCHWGCRWDERSWDANLELIVTAALFIGATIDSRFRVRAKTGEQLWT
jgi:hypothetical protein